MKCAAEMTYRIVGFVLGVRYYLSHMRHTGLLGSGSASVWRERLLGVGGPKMDNRGRAIWIHVSGPGDARAAVLLVRSLQKRLPDTAFVFTATSRAAKEYLEKSADTQVHWLPFDLSWSRRHFIRRFAPGLFVGMQGEFWPGLLRDLRRAHIGVVCLRVDMLDWDHQTEFPSWVGALYNRMLGYVGHISAGSESDRARLEAAGLPGERIELGGDYAAERFTRNAAPAKVVSRAGYLSTPCDRPLVIHATRRLDEVRILLGRLLSHSSWGTYSLLVAPAELDLVASIARHVRRSSFKAVRIMGPGSIANGEDVHILEVHGILASLYAEAHVAIIGDTFPPVFSTGANFWEPLSAGTPIICGPELELPGALRGNTQVVRRASKYQEVPSILAELLHANVSREYVAHTARSVASGLPRASTIDADLIQRVWETRGGGSITRPAQEAR